MSEEVEFRLKKHRQDFQDVTGKPFEHFFCPILGEDRVGELQKGHVVNQSLEDSAPDWVVQRKDVDSFYGTHFEADFEKLQYKDKADIINILSNSELSRKFNPTIRVGGKSISHTPMEMPENALFIRVGIQQGDDKGSISLKMTPDQFKASLGETWSIKYDVDFRLVALVSLLKAAHLTMFRMLGYHYVFGCGGMLIGKGLLGKFFRDNQAKSMDRALLRSNAVSFFREFEHALRPFASGPVNFEGTISDKKLLVAVRTSGNSIWAALVFVRAANLMSTILLPLMEDPDAVATYLDFLHNDNEKLHVCLATFDHRKQLWTTDGTRSPVSWSKQPISLLNEG